MQFQKEILVGQILSGLLSSSNYGEWRYGEFVEMTEFEKIEYAFKMAEIVINYSLDFSEENKGE